MPLVRAASNFLVYFSLFLAILSSILEARSKRLAVSSRWREKWFRSALRQENRVTGAVKMFAFVNRPFVFYDLALAALYLLVTDVLILVAIAHPTVLSVIMNVVFGTFLVAFPTTSCNDDARRGVCVTNKYRLQCSSICFKKCVLNYSSLQGTVHLE